jgi:hypothetical protein
MPPSGPVLAGLPIAVPGAAPVDCGASVRSAAAPAGRRAPYGLAAGEAQAAAAHTRATLPTARTAGTSSATNLRHGPAFPLPEANNIVTPSKASRHPRIRGPKPSKRVHLAGPSAPRAARESVSVSRIPRRTIPSEHASGGTSAALSRRPNGWPVIPTTPAALDPTRTPVAMPRPQQSWSARASRATRSASSCAGRQPRSHSIPVRLQLIPRPPSSAHGSGGVGRRPLPGPPRPIGSVRPSAPAGFG